MAKKMMEGIFGKFCGKTIKSEDRLVWQLDLNEFHARRKAFTEFRLFDLGN